MKTKIVPQRPPVRIAVCFSIQHDTSRTIQQRRSLVRRVEYHMDVICSAAWWMPCRAHACSTHRISSFERHQIANPHRPGFSDNCVDPRARKPAYIRDRNSVQANQRPKNIEVSWQRCVGKRRHDAARGGHPHLDTHLVTDAESMTDPLVLDEPSCVGANKYVHPESALIESTLRLRSAQLCNGGGRE